jgi:hypothetical protein
MIRLLAILLIFLTTFSAFAGDDLEWVKITHLRPTQLTVGFKYVKGKRKKIEKMSKDERHEYLAEHPIPAIRGYDGQLYMIDHHHLARAVQDAGYRHVFVEVKEDWSDRGLSKAEFWALMKKKGYVYLFDENNREQPVSALQVDVSELVDDPYRSLAGAVRDEGGYTKSKVPFTEFDWANYFRGFISKRRIQDHWKKSIKAGLLLANKPEAQNLPGYHGLTCEKLFH